MMIHRKYKEFLFMIDSVRKLTMNDMKVSHLKSHEIHKHFIFFRLKTLS